MNISFEHFNSNISDQWPEFHQIPREAESNPAHVALPAGRRHAAGRVGEGHARHLAQWGQIGRRSELLRVLSLTIQ